MQQSLFRRSCVVLAMASCLGWGAAAQAQPATPAAHFDGSRATLVADAQGVHKSGHRSMHRQHGRHFQGKQRAGSRGQHAHKKGQRNAGKRHQYHRSQRGPAVMVVPGFGGVGQHVVDHLELTDSQQKLLKQAQDSAKQVRLAWSNKPQKSIGTIDPRARLDQREQRRAERTKARDTSTEHWLELWDSLDDTQQAFLSGVFAERANRQMQRRHKPAETRQGRFRWQSDSGKSYDTDKPSEKDKSADTTEAAD